MNQTFVVNKFGLALNIESKIVREVILLVGFNLLLVATANIAIPLPFSLVPITGQTFGVLLAAMALGSSRGVAVVALYLAEGASGLPVFAGGAGGVQHFFGPTGGYLLGFLPAAWLVGALAERGWDRTYFKSLFTLLAGPALIFISGLSWLTNWYPEPALVLAAGLYPFIPGALIKIAAAFSLIPSLAKLTK